MSDDPKVEQLFREWVRLRKQGEKPKLEDLCAENPELVDHVRERIRQLERRIRAKRRQQESLQPSAADSDATVDKPLIQIDGYTVLREIGRGGQGIIFKALQTSTGRHVAVKILTETRQLSDTERARFDREAQVLAALEHPHIVSIFDRGHTAGGSSYFTMEYIDGQPLDKWLEGYRQDHPPPDIPTDPSELLRLFMKIADAVNVAHLRGIIHRDLKPSNILVDGRGDPHILDFGLAHLGMPPETYSAQHRVVTMTGQFLGTLPWVSPEQAEGLTSKIDTRTDVYSLGVILYEMLTGQFPYEVVGNMRDVLDNILRAQPKPPSTVIEARLAKEAEKRKRWRKKHRNPITQDLEAIVLKALSKKPQDRYQNAGEFARDIGSYLSGRPIEALSFRPPRHRRRPEWITVAVAATVVTCVLGGMWIGGYLQSRRSGESPAEDVLQSAPSVTAPAHRNLPPADPVLDNRDAQPPIPSGKDIDSDRIPAPAAQLPSTQSTLKEPSESAIALPEHRQSDSRIVLPPQPLETTEPMTRAALVSAPLKLPGVKSWTIETTFGRGRIGPAAYDRQGHFVAVGSWDGAIRLCDPNNGSLIGVLYGDGSSHVDFQCSPDGTLILGGGTLGRVFVWEVLTGRVLWSLDAYCDLLTFTPDGTHLAQITEEGLVFRNARTGDAVSVQQGISGRLPRFSSDGKLLAVAHEHDVTVYNAATQEVLLVLRDFEYVHVLQFSPDKRWLAIAEDNPLCMQLVNLQSGRVKHRFLLQKESGVSPSGIFTLDHGAIVPYGPEPPQVVDLQSGNPVRTFNTNGVLALSGDLQHAVQTTCPYGNFFRILRMSDGTVLYEAPEHTNPLTTSTVSVDGRMLVLSGYSGHLVRWPLSGLTKPTSVITNMGHWLCLLCLSREGTHLVTGGMPPIVYGMHSTDTSLNEMYNPTQDLLALTISRTGSYVASFHVDKKLRVFSWSDSKVLLEREFDIDVDSPQDSNHRQHLVFANNEDRLALIGRKGQPGIQIIDRTTGDLVSWLQMDSLPEAAAFSPEGDTLACIDPNGIVHVFDVTTRRLLQRYAHHKTAIDPWQSEQWRAAVAWSDDGRFLITVRHTTALIWDNQTRTFRQSDREYPRSTGDVWRPFLSPNGQLAIEHNSEMVRIWNTQSGQPLLTFYWSDPDHWLAVSPEGHYHCSDQMRTLLVWVIRKDDGTCELLSKEDFATKYNWVNDPYRVALHLD